MLTTKRKILSLAKSEYIKYSSFRIRFMKCDMEEVEDAGGYGERVGPRRRSGGTNWEWQEINK